MIVRFLASALSASLLFAQDQPGSLAPTGRAARLIEPLNLAVPAEQLTHTEPGTGVSVVFRPGEVSSMRPVVSIAESGESSKDVIIKDGSRFRRLHNVNFSSRYSYARTVEDYSSFLSSCSTFGLGVSTPWGAGGVRLAQVQEKAASMHRDGTSIFLQIQSAGVADPVPSTYPIEKSLKEFIEANKALSVEAQARRLRETFGNYFVASIEYGYEITIACCLSASNDERYESARSAFEAHVRVCFLAGDASKEDRAASRARLESTGARIEMKTVGNVSRRDTPGELASVALSSVEDVVQFLYQGLGQQPSGGTPGNFLMYGRPTVARLEHISKALAKDYPDLASYLRGGPNTVSPALDKLEAIQDDVNRALAYRAARYVYLNAMDYVASTGVGLAPPHGNHTVTSGGNHPSMVEYKFVSPDKWRGSLMIEYASGDSRPVALTLNGVEINNAALAGPTGGFNEDSQRWVAIGTYDVVAGENRLKIASGTHFPHLRAIKFVESTTK